MGSRKLRDCTIYVANTKVLISCTVTTQLICTFVFAYAKILFSHDVAHFTVLLTAVLLSSIALSLVITLLSVLLEASVDSDLSRLGSPSFLVDSD